MAHPVFGLRAGLALLLRGGLAAGRGLAQGDAQAGGNQGQAKAAGDKDDVDKVRQELKQLRQALQEQQKELQALRQRVKALEAGGVGVPPFRPPGTPGMAKGKVLKIDKEDKTKVTVSLGTKDGIKVGQRLMALRVKGQPRPVGVVRVTEVGEKQSTGKVEALPGLKADAAVEVDDEVMVMPAGFGGPGPFPGGPGPFPGGPGAIKARVSKVDKEKKLVTLTVSGDAKLQVGQTVTAVRLGAQPQRLGFFKVTEASAKQIVGQLTPGLPGGREGATVQEGDEVHLVPGGPGQPAPPGIEKDRPAPGRNKQPPA